MSYTLQGLAGDGRWYDLDTSPNYVPVAYWIGRWPPKDLTHHEYRIVDEQGQRVRALEGLPDHAHPGAPDTMLCGPGEGNIDGQRVLLEFAELGAAQTPGTYRLVTNGFAPLYRATPADET